MFESNLVTVPIIPAPLKTILCTALLLLFSYAVGVMEFFRFALVWNDVRKLVIYAANAVTPHDKIRAESVASNGQFKNVPLFFAETRA